MIFPVILLTFNSVDIYYNEIQHAFFKAALLRLNRLLEAELIMNNSVSSRHGWLNVVSFP